MFIRFRGPRPWSLLLATLLTSAAASADPSSSGTDDVVGLAEILAWADAHAPALLVVSAEQQRAAAGRAASSSWLPDNPTIALQAGPRVLPSVGEGGLDLLIGVSQAIPLTGEQGARKTAADADVDHAAAAVREVRWRVHGDVHALFHEAVVATARRHLAEEVLVFQDGLMAIVTSRIAVGELPPYAQALAEVEVLTARHDVVAATQAERRVSLNLAAASGWPAGRLPIPNDHREHPQQPPPLPHLVELAEKQQPALFALRQQLVAAQAVVAAEDRAAGFVPVLGVQVTQEGNPPSQGGANYIGLATLQVAVPSFDTNQGGRARARAEVAVAVAALAAAQQRLGADVASAHSELEAAIARVDTWGTEIVPRSRQHLEVLKRAFELGEIDLIALGVGRERLLSVQRAALDARRDAFVAGADLERVVGVELFDDDGHVSQLPASASAADNEVRR